MDFAYRHLGARPGCRLYVMFAHTDASRLTGIKSPTLVIQGDDDLMIPTRLSQLMAGLIPDAQIRSYPDAAHGFLFQYRLRSRPKSTFETLTVHIDRAVLFAEIAAPPMNLLGSNSSVTSSP